MPAAVPDVDADSTRRLGADLEFGGEEGSLKENCMLQPLEHMLLSTKVKETTIYQAMFRCCHVRIPVEELGFPTKGSSPPFLGGALEEYEEAK